MKQENLAVWIYKHLLRFSTDRCLSLINTAVLPEQYWKTAECIQQPGFDPIRGRFIVLKEIRSFMKQEKGGERTNAFLVWCLKSLFFIRDLEAVQVYSMRRKLCRHTVRRLKENGHSSYLIRSCNNSKGKILCKYLK
jgi:hypothetical protein